MALPSEQSGAAASLPRAERRGGAGSGLSAGPRVALLAVGLCLVLLLPRVLRGGGRDTPDPGAPQRLLKPLQSSESPESKSRSTRQTRFPTEKETKTERSRGGGRDFALTLLPLYAIGVGVFALYKFLKMKSQEERLSKRENAVEDKSKETEQQLLELEQHLSQTEKMLNSLLTQLDPLSNCINALASEQKDEIMVQLESIRKLMKDSGLDRSAVKPPTDISHVCHEKLEDLIHTFSTHPEAEVVEGGTEDCRHGAPFEDIEELSAEEGRRPPDPEESFLDPSEEPQETKVAEGANPDTEGSETGLRRRYRND